MRRLISLALAFLALASPAFAETWTPIAPSTAPSNAQVAGCIYRTAPVAPTNGQSMGTSCPLTDVGVAPIASSAAESCHVLKGSAGNLYSVSGYVGAAAWLMVFNATAAPSNGAVTPVAWAYASAAGSWSINYGAIPLSLSTGITVCASSTGPLTLTLYSTNTVFSGRVQ